MNKLNFEEGLKYILQVNINNLIDKNVKAIYRHPHTEEYIMEFDNDLLLVLGLGEDDKDNENSIFMYDYWAVRSRQEYLNDGCDYRNSYIKIEG